MQRSVIINTLIDHSIIIHKQNNATFPLMEFFRDISQLTTIQLHTILQSVKHYVNG